MIKYNYIKGKEGGVMDMTNNQFDSFLTAIIQMIKDTITDEAERNELIEKVEALYTSK